MGLRHFLYFFLQPLIFLALATLHLPRTWVALVRDGQWGAFVSPSRFKGKWFAVLWRTAGPLVRAESEARVHALVEGRVSRGRVSAEPTSAPLRGSVMEVGAGSGMWTHLFKDAEAVYAVEPNAEQHGALVRRAAELGISDRYAVVGRGVQDLEPGPGLPPVDNVVTIFCFCSIPDPERNAKAVYRFLKPGGRWYVYEHVRCHPKQGRFMRVYQRLIDTVWPQFFDGCSLCRDTARTLEQAGDWAHVDLAMPDDEAWYAGIPHTVGVLTKPGTMNA